jgi:hypothetical protein
MHLASDQRLTDPTEAAVRAALKRACAAANGKRKTGITSLDDGNFRALAKVVLGEREGYHSHCGTRSTADSARLVLAWWTAPGNRKLVRVRTWREPYREWQASLDDPRVVEQKELNTRPAVWHLDPERITRVEADGASQWVAVCGCGAAGSPESLGWAGGMCGPCRDRVEELGPKSIAHDAALLTAPGFEPWAVGFSPDGSRVVAMGRWGYRVWDRTGALRASNPTPRYNTRTTVPVVGPDGTFAFLNDDDNTLVWLDGAKGRPERVVRFGEVVRAFWTGRPGELLLQEYQYEGRVRVITLPGGKGSGWVRPPLSESRLHAVHGDPKAPRAVFCRNGDVVVAEVNPKGGSRAQSRFRLGNGQYDRTGNWTQGPEVVRFTPDGERVLFACQNHLELWHLKRRKCLVQGQLPGRIVDLCFSPDHEHLFILEAAGTIAVCPAGLLTHVRLRARLKWHAGPAAALAVSLDGATLATAGAEGVKLWPVARLLGVV